MTRIGISEHTLIKQDILEDIFSMIFLVAKPILNKSCYLDPRYHYIDMNAGPGVYQGRDGEWIVGSPIRFLRQARISVIEHKAYLVEIDPVYCKRLKEWAKPYQRGDNIEVICGDSREVVLDLVRPGAQPKLGALYTDPTGSVPPFDLLADLSRRKEYRQMDFIIFISARNYKRELKAAQCGLCEFLFEKLGRIEKKQWIVTEPMGRQQFAFLIGTNWAEFPAWKRKGFYRVNTAEGKEILERICFTRQERERMTAFERLTVGAEQWNDK